MIRLDLIGECVLGDYSWNVYKKDPCFAFMVWTPVLSIIVGLAHLIGTIKAGTPKNEEMKINLGWAITNAFLLILGLGFVVFLITNLVLLGYKIQQCRTGVVDEVESLSIAETP